MMGMCRTILHTTGTCWVLIIAQISTMCHAQGFKHHQPYSCLMLYNKTNRSTVELLPFNAKFSAKFVGGFRDGSNDSDAL